MIRRTLFLALFIVLISIQISQARVTYHNDTIATHYTPGERMYGTINISLSNASIDSQLETSRGGSISLKTFLEANGLRPGIEYNCSYAHCTAWFEKQTAVSSIALNGEAYVGLVIQGNNIENLRDVNVVIQGESGSSCTPDLRVDLLGTTDYRLVNNRYLNETCSGEHFGCFERTLNDYQYASLPVGDGYCENISLPPAPAYRLGLNVSQSGNNSASIIMQLYTVGGELMDECTISPFSGANALKECTVEISSGTTKNYFVCARSSASSSYKVRVETHAPCGTQDYGQTFPGDYEVYAKNLKFDTPRFTLNENTFSRDRGESLGELLSSYVALNYESCNPYCIIPIKLSGVAQNLQFSNISIVYDASIGQGIESHSLFLTNKVNATIDLPYRVLDIGKANFSVPPFVEDFLLSFFIDGSVIVRKNISVQAPSSVLGLYPSSALWGRTTYFSIVGANAFSSSVWNFGDGTIPQSVTGSKASHKYTLSGPHEITIDLAGNGSTRTHGSVVVSDIPTSANMSAKEIKERVQALQSNLSLYPLWLQPHVNTLLEFSTLNTSARELDINYRAARNEDELKEIISDSDEMVIPESLDVIVEGTVPLALAANSINPAPVEARAEEDVDDELLQNKIVEWMQKHYDGTVHFKTVAARYSDREEALFTQFSIDIHNREASEGEKWMYINFPSSALINPSSEVFEESEGVSYLKLDDQTRVEFALEGNVEVEELGTYIAPSLSELGSFSHEAVMCNYNKKCEGSLNESYDSCSDCASSHFILVSLTVIIICALIGGGIILWWYKKRYERWLFKSSKDLANLMSFIERSRREGMSENMLKQRLEQAGWRLEQVRYAEKKLRRK